MGWVRISDDFYDHPAHAVLGLEEWGLWLWGLAWANRNLTDGKIPWPVVKRMDPDGDATGALIQSGRWDSSDDAVEIHDYLDFQPSAADVQAKRAEISQKRAAAGSKGAASRWQPDGKPIANGWPQPQPQPQPMDQESARKRATRPTEAFAIDDELRAWGAEKVPNVDLDREREGWLLWCESKGTTYVSPRAGFQTWCRRAQERVQGSPPTLNNQASHSRFPDAARAVLGRGLDAAPIFELDDLGNARAVQ